MKKLELKCPRCSSDKARQYGRKDTIFFDDETNLFFEEEFGKEAGENYYIAECICDDCEKFFEVKVIIDVQAIEVRY